MTFGLDAEWNPSCPERDHGLFARARSTARLVHLAYPPHLRALQPSDDAEPRCLVPPDRPVGAPKGSTGIFAAFSPLGLEWKMAGRFSWFSSPWASPCPRRSSGACHFRTRSIAPRSGSSSTEVESPGPSGQAPTIASLHRPTRRHGRRGQVSRRRVQRRDEQPIPAPTAAPAMTSVGKWSPQESEWRRPS